MEMSSSTGISCNAQKSCRCVSQGFGFLNNLCWPTCEPQEPLSSSSLSIALPLSSTAPGTPILGQTHLGGDRRQWLEGSGADGEVFKLMLRSQQKLLLCFVEQQ